MVELSWLEMVWAETTVGLKSFTASTRGEQREGKSGHQVRGMGNGGLRVGEHETWEESMPRCWDEQGGRSGRPIEHGMWGGYGTRVWESHGDRSGHLHEGMESEEQRAKAHGSWGNSLTRGWGGWEGGPRTIEVVDDMDGGVLSDALDGRAGRREPLMLMVEVMAPTETAVAPPKEKLCGPWLISSKELHACECLGKGVVRVRGVPALIGSIGVPKARVSPRGQFTIAKMGVVLHSARILPRLGDTCDEGGDVTVQGVAAHNKGELAGEELLLHPCEEGGKQLGPYVKGFPKGVDPHTCRVGVGLKDRQCRLGRGEESVDREVILGCLDKLSGWCHHLDLMNLRSELAREVVPDCSLDDTVFALQILGKAEDEGTSSISSHLFVQVKIFKGVLEDQVFIHSTGEGLGSSERRLKGTKVGGGDRTKAVGSGGSLGSQRIRRGARGRELGAQGRAMAALARRCGLQGSGS